MTKGKQGQNKQRYQCGRSHSKDQRAKSGMDAKTRTTVGSSSVWLPENHMITWGSQYPGCRFPITQEDHLLKTECAHFLTHSICFHTILSEYYVYWMISVWQTLYKSNKSIILLYSYFMPNRIPRRIPTLTGKTLGN